MVLAFIVLGVSVALAVLLVARHPGTTERWLRRILFARMLFFGGLLLATALVLVFSGIFYLALIGGVILVLIVAYILLFQPQEGVSEWI